MLHATIRIDIDVAMLRRALRMSVSDLARELDCTDQTIRAMESGKTKITKFTELALAGLLYQKNEIEPFDADTAQKLTACFSKHIVTEHDNDNIRDHRIRFHIRGGEHYGYSKYIVPIHYRENYNLDVMVYATANPKDDAWYCDQIDKYGSIKGVKY